ncbi:MAG: hypothetical protein ABEJ56_05665 [Candidatus Nanohaloarchaea archaeon]
MDYDEQHATITHAIDILEEIDLDEVRATERDMVSSALQKLYHSKGRLDGIMEMHDLHSSADAIDKDGDDR